jgi:membrane protease YdiL (CAAX protease family)
MKFYFAFELIFLFFILPVMYFCKMIPVPMLAGLWLATFYCSGILLYNWKFKGQKFWYETTCSRSEKLRIIRIFIIAVILLSATVYILKPTMFLHLIRQRPALWLLILLLYGPVSVIPQEIIYRVFWFHRYRTLFPNDKAMIISSSLAFSFMHIVFGNYLAVILTFIGSLLFSLTYSRTKSFLWVVIEHYLYGILIFSSGLGGYFLGATSSFCSRF